MSGAGKVYGTAHANVTEEEIAVFKGRNANTSFQNAEPADYHAATGFEAMFAIYI
ncbi:MAG: hypothetical protein ACLRX7_05805 [Acutalibacteraceae bacterium]